MGILWWGRWWWTWSSKGSSRVRLCKKWSPMLGKKTLDLNHRNKFFFCTRPECAKLGSPGLGFIFLWVWPSHNMPGEMMHFLQESSFIQPKIPKCQIPQIDLNKPSPKKSHQTMIPPKIPSKILRSHVHPRSISVSNRPSIPCCCRWRGSATASAATSARSWRVPRAWKVMRRSCWRPLMRRWRGSKRWVLRWGSWGFHGKFMGIWISHIFSATEYDTCHSVYP